MKKRGRDFESTVLSLRLNSSEAKRFWKIYDAVVERNPFAGKSDLCRELFGLSKPQLTSKAEISYFRGETMTEPDPPELTYEEFRQQINVLGLDHLEFIEDLRGAPSERLVEVLDAVKSAVNKTLEDLTYDESHRESSDALRK